MSARSGHADASSNLKGRINDDVKAAKKKQAKSVFYNLHPSKELNDCNANLKKGYFIAKIAFANDNKKKVQNLFCWSEDAVNCLSSRKRKGCISLEDKKHILICYSFESVMQNFLSLLSNVSLNPGRETFSLIFNENCNGNVSGEGTLHLKMEICDLLFVAMSTAH